MNDDDPVIKEFEEVGRRLWEEGGGTVHGFFEHCQRAAEQARAEYAKYGDAWRGVGREPDWEKLRKGTAGADPNGAESAWTHPVGEGTMMVCEGDAPKYGETSDLARKGAEGEG